MPNARSELIQSWPKFTIHLTIIIDPNYYETWNIEWDQCVNLLVKETFTRNIFFPVNPLTIFWVVILVYCFINTIYHFFVINARSKLTVQYLLLLIVYFHTFWTLYIPKLKFKINIYKVPIFILILLSIFFFEMIMFILFL